MEKKVFFLLKLKTKIKARWIEHIIRTQIGVNMAIVNFGKRIVLIEYDSKLITPQYMRMLVRSVGCDLIFDDKEIKNRQNQLGNLLMLKRRMVVLFGVFIISIIGLICSFYNWLQFVFSISVFSLYFSLFLNIFNGHFNRFMWIIDRLGFFSSFLLLSVGIASMFLFTNIIFVLICFILSMLIIQLLLLNRWFKEKRIAERELL